MNKPFLDKGLRFSCKRCSACCRFDPGYVFISHTDIELISKMIGMQYNDFITVYCRWITMPNGMEKLSLKEKANYDCIFWMNESCSVYTNRPTQCRTFPFWPSILDSEQLWLATKLDCPGIDQGELHLLPKINALLNQAVENKAVCRYSTEKSYS